MELPGQVNKIPTYGLFPIYVVPKADMHDMRPYPLKVAQEPNHNVDDPALKMQTILKCPDLIHLPDILNFLKKSYKGLSPDENIVWYYRKRTSMGFKEIGFLGLEIYFTNVDTDLLGIMKIFKYLEKNPESYVFYYDFGTHIPCRLLAISKKLRLLIIKLFA